ncbi:BRO-N domain-containing protein [Pseudomonas sp. Z13]|uniref:BRO-N domain-containing protein n=1 Tax=Pseudomonas sp. Z13 TaxID=2983409 RepID=UPI002E807C9D|nr:Bro-N domain-containing protein [Pseudomonas sp. Z13]
MKSSRHKKTPTLAGDGVLVNEINFEEEIVMSDISTTVSNVIPFNFGKQQVRTLLIDDQPWFVANDVSAALQYSEASAMTRHLDDDEKGLSIVQTLGGDQEMLVINESGLYSAILRSRKAEAKRFKKWVTAEVLPAIRKHGRYEDTQGVMAPMVDELLGKVGAMRLSNVMRCRVAKLDAEHQRSATAKLASAVHACFGVPRVELIPSSQFEAAANFVASYAIEGEYLPKGGNPSVDIPTDLSETQRYLVFTDGTGKRQVQPVPFDACVMSPTQFLAAVTGSSGVHVPPATLFDFALAAMQKVKWRVAA